MLSPQPSLTIGPPQHGGTHAVDAATRRDVDRLADLRAEDVLQMHVVAGGAVIHKIVCRRRRTVHDDLPEKAATVRRLWI